MRKKPWFDELGNPLGGIGQKEYSKSWSARDWEQFQREHPEGLEAHEEQLEKANDIETAFSYEMSLWEFVSDDAPMHVLDKLPEFRAALEKLSMVHREILKLFYLEKKTDRGNCQTFGQVSQFRQIAALENTKKTYAHLRGRQKEREFLWPYQYLNKGGQGT